MVKCVYIENYSHSNCMMHALQQKKWCLSIWKLVYERALPSFPIFYSFSFCSFLPNLLPLFLYFFLPLPIIFHVELSSSKQKGGPGQYFHSLLHQIWLAGQNKKQCASMFLFHGGLVHVVTQTRTQVRCTTQTRTQGHCTTETRCSYD